MVSPSVFSAKCDENSVEWYRQHLPILGSAQPSVSVSALSSGLGIRWGIQWHFRPTVGAKGELWAVLPIRYNLQRYKLKERLQAGFPCEAGFSTCAVRVRFTDTDQTTLLPITPSFMKEVVKVEKKDVPTPVRLVWERLSPIRRLLFWMARQVWVTAYLVATNVDLQSAAVSAQAGEGSEFLKKSDLYRLTPVEMKPKKDRKD